MDFPKGEQAGVMCGEEGSIHCWYHWVGSKGQADPEMVSKWMRFKIGLPVRGNIRHSLGDDWVI